MVAAKVGRGEVGQTGEVGKEIPKKRFLAYAGEVGQNGEVGQKFGKNDPISGFYDPPKGSTLE